MKVVVGAEKQCFYIHPSALAARSKFFEAALKKEWRPNNEQPVELPEDDPDSFNIYLRWLYFGNVALQPTGLSVLLDSDLSYLSLAKLYSLGEKLLDTYFQDCVINAMVLRSRNEANSNQCSYPGHPAIQTIYRGTPSTSPARRLLVDIWAGLGEETWILHGVKDQSEVNHEFIIDLSKALLKNRVVLDKDRKIYASLKVGIPCAYHNHDKDNMCDTMDWLTSSYG